jgi:sugar transferase (PEP-CTERM/EpsH1 system associated)
MKILMVLSRFPYPLYKGDMLRAYYQIIELSKKNELYIACLTEDKEFPKYLPEIMPFCVAIEVVRLEKKQKFINALRGFFNSAPFQVNYFYSAEIKKKISAIIQKNKIDICYVQLIRMALNIDFNQNCLFYLDFMDCFSAGMEKRTLHGNLISQFFFKWEAQKVKNFETAIAQYFDGYSVISDADKKLFSPTFREKICVVPNGIAQEFLNFRPSSQKDIDIIFTGNMSYAPNILAALYLVKEIMPILNKQYPALKVYLVGTNPCAKIKALASNNIIVTGFVKDIKPFLGRSKVFVAPLFTGSGLQNKLLEAMATELPVLTTPLAAEALNAQNFSELIICKNAQEFSTAIYRLLTEPLLAQKIGNNAKKFIRKEYNWYESAQKLEQEWEKLFAQKFAQKKIR